MEDVKISVAFRFHVNLYHSYRGDTLDEDGIGRDIRVIRYCLDILDRYNDAGVPVRGTWDLENHFSLEQMMPKYCPDLIERIKGRVQLGCDEVEIMSYNNGLVSAETEEEFLENMRRAISNERGSGVKDIFGKYAPVVRPQECMMTPGLIRLYKQVGIEAISVYYSCIPFNGFSNFVPLLPTAKRYNPLWYTAPGGNERIALIPAINPGDVYDNFGLTRLVKRLRKEQEKMDPPRDLLVLVDMDADDNFWQGYFNTSLSFALGFKKPLLDGGLNYFIKSLSALPYVKFDTPYEYLKSHPPREEVQVGQDLADGSFDGYSSWSDKLENTKLWTGIDRTRLLSAYALAVSGQADSIRREIEENLKERILAHSTTHFGLSTPAMCKPRLQQAFARVEKNLAKARQILDRALEQAPERGSAINAFFPGRYFRGDGMKQGLIRLSNTGRVSLTGKGVQLGFNRTVFGREETALLYRGRDSVVALAEGEAEAAASVYGEERAIGNASLRLAVNEENGLELYCGSRRVLERCSFSTSVVYHNRRLKPAELAYSVNCLEGKAAILTERGKLLLNKKGDQAIVFEKKYMLVGDLPYLYVDVDISYPRTPDYGTKRSKVRRLQRGYDTRWQEIAPLELIPSFRGSLEEPIRVYKHNYLGEISYFDLDYGRFGPNHQFDSGNNAITCSFIAFTAGGQGLLIAQSAAADSNFAFCRIRLRKEEGRDKLMINPFGVYGGRQLKYAAARVGLVQKGFAVMSEAHMSCAPTFRGGRQQFSLMIAPYQGTEPGDRLINDALVHTYPPYIKSSDDRVKMIAFTPWHNYEPLD